MKDTWKGHWQKIIQHIPKKNIYIYGVLETRKKPFNKKASNHIFCYQLEYAWGILESVRKPFIAFFYGENSSLYRNRFLIHRVSTAKNSP